MKHDRTLALLQPGSHLRYLQPGAGNGTPPAWLTEADAETWQQLLSALFPGDEFAVVPARHNCSYCDRLAESYVEPPLCLLHLDLNILVKFMAGRNLEPTLANAQSLLRRASPIVGWRITPTDLTTLWPAFIQKRQELTDGH